MRVLDCTLRDGGYHTAWQFSPAFARDVVHSLDAAGVDIIELGYRSPGADRARAPFRAADDALVEALGLAPRRAALGFMLDLKEVTSGGALDRGALAALIPPAAGSRLSWCRIASQPETLVVAVAAAAWLQDRGYHVAVNLMRASSLDAAQLGRALRIVGNTPLDALYLADSVGCLTPPQTLALLDAVRARHDGPIGMHLHDNLGLALANALVAVEHGVELLDATLDGMGRGAGNVRTEQLLLMLHQRHGRADLEPRALVAALCDHLAPQRRSHDWGCDYASMVGGLVGAHPMYGQTLKAAGHDLEAVVDILDELPPSARAAFDPVALRAAEAHHAVRRTG